jgi:acyl-CoA hydrolase
VKEKKVFSRRMVKPEDLNPSGNLFGGRVMQFVDEEAAIFCMCKLDNQNLVTAHIGSIDFKSSAKNGDIIEFASSVIQYGKTSISINMTVRNKFTKQTILEIDKMVFVSIDPETLRPVTHGKSFDNESD